MMRTLLIVIFAAGFLGCGKQKFKNSDVKALNPLDFPNIDNTVYGAWKNNVPETGDKGLTKNTNVYFNLSGQMGYQVTCEQFAEKLTVGLSYPATITGNVVSVAQDIHLLQKGAGQLAECELNFAQGSWEFSVSFDNLNIRDDKRSLSFSRIR